MGARPQGVNQAVFLPPGIGARQTARPAGGVASGGPQEGAFRARRDRLSEEQAGLEIADQLGVVGHAPDELARVVREDEGDAGAESHVWL